MRFIIFGFGIHTKYTYYRYIKELSEKDSNVKFDLIVDLLSEKPGIEAFFQEKNFRPNHTYWLSSEEGNATFLSGEHMDPDLERFLDSYVQGRESDFRVIIGTEPKSHKIYALWALKHGITTIIDKPITAPMNILTEDGQAEKIYGDYLEISEAQQKSKAQVYVSAQRRTSPGYAFVHKLLQETIETYGVPITYMDIYHADGTWVLPYELDKENHPYKYQYGKIFHSGYHLIDIFSWLTELNNRVLPMASLGAFATSTNIHDQMSWLDPKKYQNLLGEDEKYMPSISENFDKRDQYRQYGEFDLNAQIAVNGLDGRIMQGSISLLQQSLSGRNWYETPPDMYKHNGRIKHERMVMNIGYLMTIHINSYSSLDERHDLAGQIHTGGDDHFDVLIFRNTNVIGGKAYQKLSFGLGVDKDEYYMGTNDYGHRKTFDQYIHNEESSNKYENHEFTNICMSLIAQSLATDAKGNPQYKEHMIKKSRL